MRGPRCIVAVETQQGIFGGISGVHSEPEHIAPAASQALGRH